MGTNVDITHYTASEHGNTLPRLLVQYLYIDIEAGERGREERREEGRKREERERWREGREVEGSREEREEREGREGRERHAHYPHTDALSWQAQGGSSRSGLPFTSS